MTPATIQDKLVKKGLFALGALALLALMALLYVLFHKPSVTEFVRERRKPIDTQLVEAGKLAQKGEFEAARKRYVLALRAARSAREEYLAEYGRERVIDSRIRKLMTPEEYDRIANAPRREVTFSYRIAEAGYGVAASRLAQWREKFGQHLEKEGFRQRLRSDPQLEAILDVAAEGLAVYPEKNDLRLLKTQVLKLMGRYPEALKALKTVLQYDSTFVDAYIERGLVYAAWLREMPQNNAYKARARQAFETAADVARSHGIEVPDAHYNLGVWYAANLYDPADKSGVKDARHKAIEHFETFLRQAGPEAPGAATARAELVTLKRAP